MLKKINLFILALFTLQAFGMGIYENQSTIINQAQLDHIKAQMLALKRAWNSERLRIKIAQKASPTAYQTMAPILEKIIASNDFITKLNTVVSNQFDAITNNNMAFNSIKSEFNIADFFPNITINEFGKKLFSALANKACYLELGKLLAQKMQELLMISAISSQNVPVYAQ